MVINLNLTICTLLLGVLVEKLGRFHERDYRTQHIIDGETLEGVALFSKTDNKLEKIGHVNTKEVISTAIKEALLTSNKEKDNENKVEVVSTINVTRVGKKLFAVNGVDSIKTLDGTVIKMNPESLKEKDKEKE